MAHVWSEQTHQLIRAAIDEDLGGAGDLTAALLSDPDESVRAAIIARQAGVVCGLSLVPLIVESLSERLGAQLDFHAEDRVDGDKVDRDDVVGELHGPKSAVLTAERTVLNFLARMSGVATLTRGFVIAVQSVSPTTEVFDTRKTIPGWRELDRYAVRCGGGVNHRFGLHDAVLIKDNHLAGVPVDRLASTLTEMLSRLACLPKFVQVEVDELAQLEQVCAVSGIDIVLLDNFSIERMREAVELRDSHGLRDKLALEASGGITLETVASIAGTGIDRISIGALTHSAPSLDLALDFR